VDILNNGMRQLPVSTERIAETSPTAWQQNIPHTAVRLTAITTSQRSRIAWCCQCFSYIFTF